MHAQAGNGDAKWFCLTMLFQCVVGENPGERRFCEERIVVVEAASEHEARNTGLEYGTGDRTTYHNEDGEVVTWSFLRILAIVELDSGPTAAGWEVGSRLLDCPTHEARAETE